MEMFNNSVITTYAGTEAGNLDSPPPTCPTFTIRAHNEDEIEVRFDWKPGDDTSVLATVVAAMVNGHITSLLQTNLTGMVAENPEMKEGAMMIQYTLSESQGAVKHKKRSPEDPIIPARKCTAWNNKLGSL